MELKDYVNKVEEEKKKQLPSWLKIYQNIENFNIPNEKLKLIKSFHDYIKVYNFNSYGACANDSKNQGYLMQQVKTTNNSTAGALIEIKLLCKESDGMGDYTIYYKPLEESEYQARTNRFKLEGSQEFYKLYVGISGGGFNSAYKTSNDLNFTSSLVGGHIFYSRDGKVFLTQKLVDAINRGNEATLGNFLAEEVVKIKEKKYLY